MSQTEEPLKQPDSCTRTNHKIVKFTHRWDIENFNFYFKSAKPNDWPSIVSPKFSQPNDSTLLFFFALYPKGDESITDHEKGYVSIYLHLSSCPKPEIRVQFKLSTIDQKNIKRNTQCFVTQFNPNLLSWGFPKYMTHEELNGWLVNDKLTLFCEIEAMLDTTHTSGDMITKEDTRIESQVLENLGDLFKNRIFSDVVLVAGNLEKTEHRAHRAILATRSPVFCAMFENHWSTESNEGRVRIEDISGDVIEEMLRFVYTGKVLKLDELADGLLCIAADKYELDLLKDICERHLIKNMNTETVLAVLIIADRHSSPLLRFKSIEYINANLPSLVESDNWQAVKDNPELYFEFFSKAAIESQQEHSKVKPKRSFKFSRIFKKH